MERLKSLYFLKIVFSFLNEKSKLKVIKYKKNLQTSLNISLINYKFFSGKYIIYESNGGGKEYDGYSDELRFEGEFLHGERKGKVKEYDEDDNLIFEGEYIKGLKYGKGREFYKNGKLMFEGEYLSNKWWNGKGYDRNWNIAFELYNGTGKVKEYDSNGILIFEGEYLKAERNGKGKEFNKHCGKLNYEGEFLNGKRNGKGKEYDNYEKLIFEGKFLNGKKWEGKGYFYDKIIYELNIIDRKSKEYYLVLILNLKVNF